MAKTEWNTIAITDASSKALRTAVADVADALQAFKDAKAKAKPVVLAALEAKGIKAPADHEIAIGWDYGASFAFVPKRSPAKKGIAL